MKTILTYLSITISIIANSQQGDYFLSIKQYPFINYNENKLQFPADSNYFESLYQQLDSIILYGKGKLNIVHIGGSHIQADIYTHQIRKRLQSLQYDMNGGRGLLFPFTMAKTNNPSNYKVIYTGEWSYCKNTKYKRTCELGLTGISVSTLSRDANIYLSPNRDSTINYSFNKVKVFHAPTEYKLSLVFSDSTFNGIYDSIAGLTRFEIPLSSEIALHIVNSDSIDKEFTLYGISLDNDEPGIVYNAIGVNGAKLESFNYCELFSQHLKSIKPDLVIFSIGTNDGNTKNFNSVKFYQEYEQLISKSLLAFPDTKILITVPNDAYYYKRYVNKNTPRLKNEILKLAKNNNYAIWDFFSIMGGLDSSQQWYNYNIMRYDRIHFTREGYLLKGDLFVTALLRGWEKNLTARSEQYFDSFKISQNLSPSQTISK